MNPYRISAVSYTNSQPFVWGIKHFLDTSRASLSLDDPAACAQKLLSNQVDIGLVPVATLLGNPHLAVISSFGICANGPVNSVFLFSQVPLDAIESVLFDPQSRTSNLLAQVLAKHYWHITPSWMHPSEALQPAAQARVLIGDRTFAAHTTYPYRYDLSQAWYQFTGLPFVFAAWVCNKPIEPVFLAQFHEALAQGVAHLEAVIAQLPLHPAVDLGQYLRHHIGYHITPTHQQAMERFLTWAQKLSQH